jgi:hypothetical protein
VTEAETLFHEIATQIKDVTEGQMFGAMCYKTPNGKAAAMFWKGDMVFKLEEETAQQAMMLKGVKVFEPAAGKKMGGWYQVPFIHAYKWKEFAKAAVKTAMKVKK